MGDLKGRIRKLEEELTGEMITIPQLDGTLRRSRRMPVRMRC